LSIEIYDRKLGVLQLTLYIEEDRI